MSCFYDGGLHVLLYYNGRTDRASLQPLYVSLFGNGRSTERPYNRYTSRCSGTDALPLDTSVRLDKGLLVSLEEFKPHRGIYRLLARR